MGTLVKTWSVDVTARLAGTVPWSPLDFIKGVSVEGDRALHLGSLTRDVDPRDDLRFVCPVGGGTDVAVCAERLPWDSEFFGYDVARLQAIVPLAPAVYRHDADYTLAVQELMRAARERGVRYLFAVIDARDLATQRALAASGFMLLETRVYFQLALRHYQFPRRFRCRVATAGDLEGLSELARTAENPFDRFNADPFIDKRDTVRLLDAWLRASVLNGFADLTYINDTARPTAVCTVKYHQDKHAAWGVALAQLVLAMAGPGGRFLGVISEINYHLKERGFDYVYFTTQLPNYATIRVGERLGFRIGRGEYVFRLLL